MTIPSPLVLELRAIRRELGLSLTQVADRLEIRSSALSDWENGIHQPYLSSLELWASALGYELDLHPISRKKAYEL